jgi:hypothetical protein
MLTACQAFLKSIAFLIKAVQWWEKPWFKFCPLQLNPRFCSLTTAQNLWESKYLIACVYFFRCYFTLRTTINNVFVLLPRCIKLIRKDALPRWMDENHTNDWTLGAYVVNSRINERAI